MIVLNRIRYSPILCLVALALIALLGAYGDFYTHHKDLPKKQVQFNDNQAAQDTLNWLEAVRRLGQPETSGISAKDDKPNSDQYTTAYDLRAQWVTAIATREMVTVGYFQIALSLAGFVALVWTVILNRQSVNAAVSASNAGERSAKATEDTLVAIQRPWVSVELGMGSGIIYSAEEARLTIRFAMKNVGNSPAINVWVDAKIALVMNRDKTSMGEFKEFCAAVRNKPDNKGFLGQTIFPGETLHYGITMSVRLDEIQSSIPIAGKINFFNPDIIGCVSYYFPFQNGIHTTEFFATIRKLNPENPNIVVAFDISKGDVPLEQIVIQRTFIGGSAN